MAICWGVQRSVHGCGWPFQRFGGYLMMHKQHEKNSHAMLTTMNEACFLVFLLRKDCEAMSQLHRVIPEPFSHIFQI